eukprot:TRINITY_DN37448_c0_g1_i1.p1 TRINITY_DN37448_c0_g1~~TRINITY_DN37448_c0_g1_i1.p1  ORF type:complete len:859 (+),score=163.80 TRINITY_DN37448_c0_g1_i1:80-2656(+)
MQEIGGLAVACDRSEYFEGGYVASGYNQQLPQGFQTASGPTALIAGSGAYVGYAAPSGYEGCHGALPVAAGSVVTSGGQTLTLQKSSFNGQQLQELWPIASGQACGIPIIDNGSTPTIGIAGVSVADTSLMQSGGSLQAYGAYLSGMSCGDAVYGGQYGPGDGQCGGQTVLLGLGNGMGVYADSQLFQQQADDGSRGQHSFFNGRGHYLMQNADGGCSMVLQEHPMGGFVTQTCGGAAASNAGKGRQRGKNGKADQGQKGYGGMGASQKGQHNGYSGGSSSSKGGSHSSSSKGAARANSKSVYMNGRGGNVADGESHGATAQSSANHRGHGGANGTNGTVGTNGADGTDRDSSQLADGDGDRAPITNLFVSNLKKDTTLSDVREVFRKFGHVVSCRVFVANSRTCALVKMNTVAEAEAAVRACDGRPWNVKFADKDSSASQPKAGAASQGGGAVASSGSSQQQRKMVSPTSGRPSSNLYVKGLPLYVADYQLQQTFSKVGKVVEMKIMRYQDTQECAALVRMETVEAATSAVDQLDGQPVVGYTTPLTVRHRGKENDAPGDNLYVKGLPPEFSQDELQLLFAKFGSVKRCRLLPPVQHEGSNGKAGFSQTDAAGLVQMGTIEEASSAIQALNGTVPEGVGARMIVRFAAEKDNGRNTTVAPDTPSDNLYVKGLPLGTPDMLLRAVFAQFGTVTRLKVLPPRPGDATTNDCAALVQMSSVGEAEAAVTALHGRALAQNQPGMRIRFAGRDQQPGANLYVAGLPTTILEEHLRATFAACGGVVRLRLLVQSGRPETHALVQMASEEEARAAITQLSGKPPVNFGMSLVVRYAAKRQYRDNQEPGMEAMVSWPETDAEGGD